MAPIKLEEHIREKLQEREIQPSKAAWSKLENQLGESDRKSPFIWYAIAASFIGIIIVTSFVFNNTDNNDQFVDENMSEKVETEIPSEVINNDKTVEQITPIPSEEVAVETIPQENKEQNATPNASKEQQIIQKKLAPKQDIASNKTEAVSENISPSILNTKTLENAKIEEVVAQVKSMQNDNNLVSQEEIDALLFNAQRELQTERILNRPKVDATALLEDIEFEMERSFRDKVFDALGDGFNKVRTVVSDRNN